MDRALARAKETDDYLRDNGKVIGPLHGLPISLKDQFTIQGLETIMGEQYDICVTNHSSRSRLRVVGRTRRRK